MKSFYDRRRGFGVLGFWGFGVVLARPGLFLNTSSDATILRHILDAASQPIEAPSLKTLEQDVERYAMAPIFVRGETDEVR